MTDTATTPATGDATEVVAEVVAERHGNVGFLTLHRPRALNALSLQMVRDLHAALAAWQDDPAVQAVAIRGTGKEGPFGSFCAGGDIRFLHRAGTEGDVALEAFFTEEYALNHLIHTYPKPYIAFMDGIVMGGGMGISQGASLRIVTERTKMAMPETAIGLFPDVGGGYFLSRCPGSAGEWLGLTGDTIGADDAIALCLADRRADAASLPDLWRSLQETPFASRADIDRWIATELIVEGGRTAPAAGRFDAYFSLPDVPAILAALDAADTDETRAVAATLRKRSPLMLFVVLEQIRRARGMDLADDLRMERDMVHRCFHLRPGASETLEGIRALAVDKDHAPRWNPARIEAVTPEMVAPFFKSPWTAETHPLRGL